MLHQCNVRKKEPEQAAGNIIIAKKPRRIVMENKDMEVTPERAERIQQLLIALLEDQENVKITVCKGETA